MGGSWWARLRAGFAPVRAELLDGPPPREDPRPQLLSIAAEAVIRQDEAEQVLVMIRQRVMLGIVARQAGPLVRRFFALRDSLPASCAEADDERLRRTLDVVLHHHAMVLAMAQDLLAYEWRSERIARQVDTLDGLGAPARLLDEVYAELSASSPTAARRTVL